MLNIKMKMVFNMPMSIFFFKPFFLTGSYYFKPKPWANPASKYAPWLLYVKSQLQIY
jgi:hypothetical protein